MGLECGLCGKAGADLHTGICSLCLVDLSPYFRKQAEQRAISAALIRQALVRGGIMGGVRWNEKQYADFLKRQQAPAPREERKASGKPKPVKKLDARTITFELELTPMRNALDRMHYRVKRRLMGNIADMLRAQIPNASGTPFQFAKVEIVRCSAKEPDKDGLYGSVKPILDAMQVASKRHPYGAFIIENDDSDHIELVVRWEKAAPKKGKVVINVTPRP